MKKNALTKSTVSLSIMMLLQYMFYAVWWVPLAAFLAAKGISGFQKRSGYRRLPKERTYSGMTGKQLIYCINRGAISLLLMALLACGENKTSSEAGSDWPVYLGGKSSNHYSPLDQINRENVGHLVPAWEYHTGDDLTGNHTQIQCNPLIIGGVLYGSSPKLKIFALDAASGKRLWEFDPNAGGNFAMNVNRGVSYWEDGEDKRILFTAGAELFALNAATGQPVSSFGQSGHISLKEGLGERSKDLYVVATSPGIVYRDLIIIGSRVSENSDAAPGFIRAFSVRTGKLAWTFHTIPRPGEAFADTWPSGSHETAGGANCWAGMSLDEKRGIVFVPTGSAAFDFWGGNRHGQNLFANCVLALNAQTGERIWHFQTIHHDLWDRDLPAPPNLVTVTHQGKKKDAVAQITKTGFVFLLSRETGEPLFPVEERPVPSSDADGEQAWPTQPFPLLPPPLVPQQFNRNNITDISRESHEYIDSILSGIRTGAMFIPPGEQKTMIFPGFDGGGEWGGAAVDPRSSILYVNMNSMPWIHQMVRVEKDQPSHPGQPAYNVYCAVCHGQNGDGNAAASYPSLHGLSGKYSQEEILSLINSGKGFMPSFRHLKEQEKKELIDFVLNGIGSPGKPAGHIPDTHMAGAESNRDKVPYTHTGYNRFLDQEGFPAVKPPWGTLSAVDLNTGTIKWQVPLGEFEELTERGIPKTGTENYGGPVVTAGGLLFIGASKDGYLRAFDTEAGEELWKYKLPAGGYATPSVYEVNGTQYLVIACGGGKMGTPSGDSYLAFTLGTKKEKNQ